MLSLRLLGVVVLVLASCAALVPTVFPASDIPGLPDSRIHLGVQLQGGTELVLEVESEVAIWREVAEDAAYLEATAARDALEGLSARVFGTSNLEIVSDAPPDRILAFVDRRLGSYVPVASDGVHRFALSERRKEAIYARAVTQIVDRLEQTALRCADGAVDDAPFTVEHIGSGRIAVELPGFPEGCL